MTKRANKGLLACKSMGASAFRRLVSVSMAVTWTVGAAFVAAPALAHSFSVTIVAADDESAALLPSVLRGFLVASAERDGHANETADGHLGGLDVLVTPLPADAALGVEGLFGPGSGGNYDVAVVLGGSAMAPDGTPGISTTTVVMRPGALPDQALWARSGPNTFNDSFTARFEGAPDEAAALGYNAARRIDLAVRDLGGISDPALLSDTLANTENGIEW